MHQVEPLNLSASSQYPMRRKEEIERALSTLSRRMALSGTQDLEVLCCGASALCVLGLLSRSTMDVDVLGIISGDKEVEPCEHFSPEMEAAIAESGREVGLPDDVARRNDHLHRLVAHEGRRGCRQTGRPADAGHPQTKVSHERQI